MGDEPRQGWYGARLVFAIGREKEAGLLTVQEDRLLVQSPNAEAAYKETLAGAAAAANMGAALVEGTPEALEDRGLSDYIEVFFEKRTPLQTGRSEIDSQNNADFPSGSYSIYEFLGLADLWFVGYELNSGTEVDRYMRRQSRGARVEMPAQQELLAFDPAGPAYRHQREVRNSDLYRRYQWYLAEEWFESSVCDQTTVRLVLINAEDPNCAYDLAKRDGVGFELADTAFAGIAEMSLVMGDLRGTSVLRTDEYVLEATGLGTLVKSKTNLRAFREEGF